MPGRDRPAWREPGAVAAVALALFLLLTAAVVAAGRPYFGWDLAVSRAVQSARSPALDAAMRFVSLAGDDPVPAGILVGTAFFALLFFLGWRAAAALLGVVLAGQILKIGIKLAVGRPRPADDLVDVLIDAHEVHSFPSGHTVHYVVFFGFLWLLADALAVRPIPRRLLKVACGGLVLLVGLARIYLGAHWVSDVAGGYLLGGAVLAAVGGSRRFGRPG